MKALVACGAQVTGKDPEDCSANYRFPMGLNKDVMNCPVTFASAVRGDTKMLRALVEAKADLSQMGIHGGTPNFTLLWFSCYHGHHLFVREVLKLMDHATKETMIEQKA